jgi:hypothetical protein
MVCLPWESRVGVLCAGLLIVPHPALSLFLGINQLYSDLGVTDATLPQRAWSEEPKLPPATHTGVVAQSQELSLAPLLFSGCLHSRLMGQLSFPLPLLGLFHQFQHYRGQAPLTPGTGVHPGTVSR